MRKNVRRINRQSHLSKLVKKGNRIVFVNSNLKTRCPDCDFEIAIPSITEKGEILSCPSCGLELEVQTVTADGCVTLQELTIEGEDWGE